MSPDTPEKNARQAGLFANRLSKQYRQLKKWARRNLITCYRLYDRDIPEIPLACDLYEFLPEGMDAEGSVRFLTEKNEAISRNDATAGAAVADGLSRTYLLLYLYERPYEKAEQEEERWLHQMARAAADTLQVHVSHVVIKTRRHQDGTAEGRSSQYERNERARELSGTVCEQGELLRVNLSAYIDTGLFFDHRPLRGMVRAESAGKRVLNLFCYTGSFSVYAAAGGARLVTSVDMSNTYVEWAKENMRLNGFSDAGRFRYERTDAVEYLRAAGRTERGQYDLIVLDPPTFSNSKRTATTIDLNRDWPELIRLCLPLLAPGGTLYFSTNSQRLRFSAESLPAGAAAEDISARTIPPDIRNARAHRVWRIRGAEPAGEAPSST